MSLARFADDQGLHRVGARPPLFSYLKQVWQRREFAFTMARFKIQAQQQRNRLGMLWLVVQPCLNALIYGLIFGLLQTAANRPPDYAAYVVIGVFMFEFFSKSLSNGAKSITGNRALVQSLAFPRITLPFAVVLENLLALVPMLGVMVVALVVMGHFPAWEWLLMLPLLALYTLFNTGVAMIAARLTVHVRDLTQILPFINRILFFTSGVLFSVDRIFEAHPWVIALYDFHPIYQVLQISRGVLMHQGLYAVHYWILFGASAVLCFVVGLLFFWVAEERYGRD